MKFRIGHVTRALALAGLASAFACGPAEDPTGPNAQAIAIRAASERLRGAWRVQGFRPDVPLEPMLQVLLASTMQSMVVHFDGTRVRAESPGIHFNRPYEVKDASGDWFRLVSWDDSGVPYESQCEFGPNQTMTIYSQTPPWRGVGTMLRSGDN